MSISKTRQKLVDVARQLFAKNGIANTTMNDIAKASGKGRRTLYTYFKSKDDVYSAVIESELERLSDKLDEVANKKISPQDKIELFRKVYSEAKADGEFDIDDVYLVADITHYCIKGLEVPFIYGRLGHGLTEETSRPMVAKVVYGALGKTTLKQGQ